MKAPHRSRGLSGLELRQERFGVSFEICVGLLRFANPAIVSARVPEDPLAQLNLQSTQSNVALARIQLAFDFFLELATENFLYHNRSTWNNTRRHLTKTI